MTLKDAVTATITLDESRPVADWLKANLDDPGMMIGGRARPGLDRFIQRAAQQRRRGEFPLRLNVEQMQSFQEQLRSYECCADELPEHIREQMPAWEYFNALSSILLRAIENNHQ